MFTGIEKINYIIIVVTAGIYLVFLSGFWLVYSRMLVSSLSKLKMHNRLKARRKALKPEGRIEKHLRTVLNISLKKPLEPKLFIHYTILIFILIFIVGLRNVSPVSALLISFIIAAMPYLLLRVRIETIRRKSSYEGEKLISEFLCQYRICGLNIYKTMEQVVVSSEGTAITGKLLFKLLLELRGTGNSHVIKEATERFSYGINTSWSRMLANCIRISAQNGTNVCLALEDIQIQLREARQLYEERKRLNSESARMVVFLAPVMYLGTFIMSVKYLDIPFPKMIRNQFYTEQGFILILLIAFLFLINLALIEVISSQRFDY